MKSVDIFMDGLLIGRFQPFHLGHLAALRFALTKVDKLWIGLGSSNKPLQKNNPFSAEERKEMILASIDESMKQKIQIYFIPDLENHIKWIDLIDTLVPKFDVVFTNDDLTKHLYSKRNVTVMSIPFFKRDALSGTNIRDMIISDQKWEELVPEGTKSFLNKTSAKQRLKNL
ncbi:cytidyltransferase-like protein [Candidatus Nitrosarchaeum limnium SFB1]|jgi:nicotinamide-nucleotide adenylyltransferase|uniref:Nicotinamide-nucleotide adenylyltransferase n=1 Tax=Candidatus Nitrosarchaeum limnium SFB1 TaxID=886738 RepID=F3KLS3_9ARCH|nr:cytidyltransferase-like protein [Candidatus Nitrosarchaeum limnium SFB1]